MTTMKNVVAEPDTSEGLWPGSRATAAQLLGGRALLRTRSLAPLDVHTIIEQGFSSKALGHLADQVQVLGAAAVHKAVGMSVRTSQRRKLTPRKPLSPEQSGRAWKFAEVLAKATEVFGTQRAGEEWLAAPATALGGQKPIELLSTPVGTEMVERLLGRIEFGVYT
jgi:putative toxin-antitoxin system antitoxin component (TIGR02293 family)